METFEQMLWKSFCAGFAEVYGRSPVVGTDCNSPQDELCYVPDCETDKQMAYQAHSLGVKRAMLLIGTLLNQLNQK